MRDLAQNEVETVAKKTTNIAFYDKVFNLLQSRMVIVGEDGLNDFPHMVCTPGQNVTFKSEGVVRNILDV